MTSQMDLILLRINTKLAVMNAKLAMMQASNQSRMNRGLSPAYDSRSFDAVIRDLENLTKEIDEHRS